MTSPNELQKSLAISAEAEERDQQYDLPGPEAQDTLGHIPMADRVSLVSWGTGSAPSFPSIDSDNETDRDDDSAIGSMISSTVSVRSSVYDYVQEHGRTYHRYKEGKYPLPNDPQEQDRLDLQHALFVLTTQGKLYLAPIGDNPQNVLDIGTGTGIWSIEFAQEHPGATVLGTDLSPIQPPYVPPNCKFEIDDAEDEWTFSTKFDFVHGRALLSCFTDPAEVIKQAYSSLAPGGWLELQDGYFPMAYVGEKRSDCALYRWNELCCQGAAKAGRPWTNAQHYKRWMEEAGFEDVVERKFYWPMNPWPKGQYYKSLGSFFLEDMLAGLDGISFKVLRTLGWSMDEIQVLLAQVRNDMKDTSIHAYLNIVIVYGRKPGSVVRPT